MTRQWIALFLFFFISFNVSSETFEQAYAPISVGDITIFIPIDRQPALPPSLSIKASGNQYLLEWNADGGAARYKVEHLVNGAWALLSDSISTNSYQTSINNGPNFRVSACDRYGCSDWRTVNNIVSGELMISQFSKSADAVSQGSQVALSWNVSSAVKIEITSNKGHRYTTYVGQGQKAFTINQFTQFTLKATSFGKSYSQKLIVSPTAVIPDFRATPKQDTYTQPLLELVKSNNQKMLPIERALLSTRLIDGSDLNIIPQQDNKLSRVSNDGVVIWTLVLDGLVANQPVLKRDTNELFFSMSSLDGTGRLCKVDINGDSIACFTKKPGSTENLLGIVAAPLLLEDRLFAFDTRGALYEVSSLNFTADSYRALGSVPLLQGDAILTTPAIDKTSAGFIIRTKKEQIIALNIPSSPNLVNRMMKKTMSLFSSSSASDAESPSSLEVQWTKSLTQEEGK
ncbi:hypothetical protein Sps_03023 [Shewanella psychrophila]|uniref:Fibronectin type-III domain-containing protein n=1 Tax=Shewanella psychrophila TaxID=225848 RepID=A0A1S6HRL6_9GAMM|nr:hypothetical protein [Shewanella psychrophila]AQS38170.1 hypothetical protein Sps_03023 [Shewanella psychrophila]